MKVKTIELTGVALNWAVGIANGWTTYPSDSIERGDVFHCDPTRTPHGATIQVSSFKPSTDWWHGGPIIEREDIWVRNVDIHVAPAVAYLNIQERKYLAQIFNGKSFTAHGETMLIAAMRCYVASKLGDEVEVPDELL